MANLIDSLNSSQRNESIPQLQPGDTVRVHTLIVEGEKERVQVFQGLVIRTREGGVNSSFTVRRIAAHGVGVERSHGDLPGFESNIRGWALLASRPLPHRQLPVSHQPPPHHSPRLPANGRALSP